jgi:hypothetical protein
VAVPCAAGEHTTAGLGMPKSLGPGAACLEPAPGAKEGIRSFVEGREARFAGR